MRRYKAAATSARRSRALLALLLGTTLGLAGCGSIDDALFGSDTSDQGAAPAEQQAAAAEPQAPAAGVLPGAEGQPGAPAPVAGPATAGITPVTIEQGQDTGTAVNHTIQSLRGQVAGIQDRLLAEAQQFADLKATALQSSQQYHESKAAIAARLQLGTTRGNPELVAQWNSSQAALDSMTGQINSLNALGTQVADQASAAHFVLNTIEATFNIAGAVDEDHRQLGVLRDETDQVIVLIDSLLTSISETVERQTTYVANERASLTTLASAIKTGSYFGDLSSPASVAPASYASFAGGPVSGPALVTIKFDRARVDYQQILYTAVAQALQSRPGSGFAVVAVSPTRGTAAAVQLAQTDAVRHARDVIRSLSDMGVPADRLNMSSSTDPGIGASEVRVYVR
jgi:hypothetical protein